MKAAYPLYNVDRYDDFLTFVDAVGQKYAGKPAVTTYDASGAEHTRTYADLARDVTRARQSLSKQALAGQNIAIVGENSYPWLVAMLGVCGSGGVAVTIDIEQSDAAISQMVLHADVHAIFCSPPFQPLCVRIAAANASIRAVVALYGDAIDGVISLQEFTAQADGGADDRVLELADRPALIVYTSGTTSTSKPVLLTHRQILSNAYAGSAMVWMGPRVYTPLPMHHTYGLSSAVFTNMTQGRHMCINGNIKTMLQDIARFEPETLFAVPLIAETLLQRITAIIKAKGSAQALDRFVQKQTLAQRFSLRIKQRFPEEVKAVLGGRISTIVCGGAHLNQNAAKYLDALGIQVLEGYGITECSPLISVNRNRANRYGSVGLPVPDTQVKLVDEEIWVHGPSVSGQYYKDPEMTRESYEDGWFKTGDIGFIDRDGFLYVRGRKKNLIVFKNSKKVTPEEIECAAAQIPLIKECMAYGATNGASEDDVKLALMVYPDPDKTRGMAAYEILQKLQVEIDQINRGNPSYKQIQIIKLRDSPFERTATKKIKRQL